VDITRICKDTECTKVVGADDAVSLDSDQRLEIDLNEPVEKTQYYLEIVTQGTDDSYTVPFNLEIFDNDVELEEAEEENEVKEVVKKIEVTEAANFTVA